MRFSFLDRLVATYFHVPKHAEATTEQRMVEELREWAALLEEARDYWCERAVVAEEEIAQRGSGIAEKD